MQKEGLRRPRSQRTSRRRADGGADEAEGGRGQGTERDATIDHSQHTNTQTFIHNTPRYANGHTKDKTFTPRKHHGHEPPDHPNPPTHPHDLATTESAAGSINSRSQPRSRTIPAADCPTQKRPPPANPTRPPPAPRAPPRACSKAVGEMKARAADASRPAVARCGRARVSRVSRLPPVSFYRNVHHVPAVMLARAVSATPPSIVTVIPVLGGPECVRALCWSQVKSIRKQQTTIHTEAYRMCSGGQQWWKGVGGDGGYDLT